MSPGASGLPPVARGIPASPSAGAGPPLPTRRPRPAARASPRFVSRAPCPLGVPVAAGGRPPPRHSPLVASPSDAARRGASPWPGPSGPGSRALPRRADPAALPRRAGPGQPHPGGGRAPPPHSARPRRTRGTRRTGRRPAAAIPRPVTGARGGDAPGRRSAAPAAADRALLLGACSERAAPGGRPACGSGAAGTVTAPGGSWLLERSPSGGENQPFVSFREQLGSSRAHYLALFFISSFCAGLPSVRHACPGAPSGLVSGIACRARLPTRAGSCPAASRARRARPFSSEAAPRPAPRRDLGRRLGPVRLGPCLPIPGSVSRGPNRMMSTHR